MAGAELKLTLTTVTDGLEAGLRAAESRVTSFVSNLEARFANLNEATEGLNKAFGALFSAQVGGEIFATLGKLVVHASDVKDAFDEAAASGRNMGKGVGNGDDLLEFTRKLSQSAEGGGYAFDEMATAAQRFRAIGADTAQTEYLLGTTAKLAAGFHIGYAEAADMLTRGAAGMARRLKEVGIEVKNTDGSMRSLSQITADINAKFADAATIRATGLVGQLGIMRNSFQALTDDLETSFIPAVTVIVGILEHLIQTFQSLPGPVKDAAAIVLAVGASLTALGFIIPGIARAFSALWTGMLAVYDVCAELGATILGPVIKGFQALWIWVGYLKDAFAEGAIAEWAMEAPLGAIVIAIAALIAAIVVVAKNWGAFKRAGTDAIQALGDAWTEFGEHFKTIGERIHAIAKGVWDVVAAGNPATRAAALADLATGLASTMPKFTEKLTKGISDGMAAGVAEAKKVWASFMDWLTPKLPHTAVPTANLNGLGDQGSKGASAAGELVKNFLAELENRIADTQYSVDKARGGVDTAKANAKAYQDNLDPDSKKWTPAQVAQLEALQRKVATAEGGLQAALIRHAAAQDSAAKATAAWAKALPASLKNHGELSRQLQAASRRYGLAAVTTGNEAINAGGDRAAIGHDIAKESDDLAAHIAEKLRASAELASTGRVEGMNDSIAGDEQHKALMSASGANDPLGMAALEVAIAKTKLRIAEEDEARAKLIQKIDVENGQTERAAQDAADVATAHRSVITADNQLAIAQGAAAKAVADHAENFGSVLKGIIAKLNVPGIEANKSGTGLAFNWVSFLVEAFSKTKSFGDIMATVTKIVGVVAQVLDALRPVIDILLKALLILANGFVSLWNVVARILRLFGLHVELLDKVNTNLAQTGNNLVPLIQITHDIPTLDELATGRAAGMKYSTDPQAVSRFTNPIVSQLQDPSLGGGLLDGLGAIVAAIVGLKVAMAAGSFFQGIMGAGKSAAGGAGGFSSSMAKISSFLGTKIGGATIGSAMLAAAGGAIVGNGIGHLMNNGQNDASIGGAIGGAAGSVFGAGAAAMLGLHLGALAGPLGAVAGAVLGSVIGGLFGSHDKPENMPDKYDTQRYGTVVTDLMGGGENGSAVQNVNGQQFTMEGSVSQATGGQGGIKFIEEQLAKYGSKDKAPDWLKPMWDQMVSLFGISATGSGKLNFGKDIGDEHVSGAAGASSTDVKYTDLGTAFDQFMTAMQNGAQGVTDATGQIGGGAQAIYHSVSATANELAAGIAQATGAIANAVSGVGGSIADTLQTAQQQALKAVGSIIGPAGGGAPRRTDPLHRTLPVTINNHFHGDITTGDDYETIGANIGAATRRTLDSRRYAIAN